MSLPPHADEAAEVAATSASGERPGRPRPRDGDEVLVAFTRALAAAGVGVSAHRTQTFLAAAVALGADTATGVYHAGRATLCAGPDDLTVYDRVFEQWFGGNTPRAARPRSDIRPGETAPLNDEEEAAGEDGGLDDTALRTAASRTDVLRHRDVADLTVAERVRLARLFSTLDPRHPRRTAPRRRHSRRGEIDLRTTLRAQLRHHGEPVRLLHRRRTTRARRVVLLVDVSGSMRPYADSLLRLAHRITQADPHRTETFTIGTRLTRVTAAMRGRDPQAALRDAGDTIPDWSGGTRLGDSLRAFAQRWGRRGLARSAVVVIVSDGWERGDCGLLAEQMADLHRVAHHVVWMNPHRGKEGYAAVQSGIVAALPYVDSFIAGHSLHTFAEALEVIADA